MRIPGEKESGANSAHILSLGLEKSLTGEMLLNHDTNMSSWRKVVVGKKRECEKNKEEEEGSKSKRERRWDNFSTGIQWDMQLKRRLETDVIHVYDCSIPAIIIFILSLQLLYLGWFLFLSQSFHSVPVSSQFLSLLRVSSSFGCWPGFFSTCSWFKVWIRQYLYCAFMSFSHWGSESFSQWSKFLPLLFFPKRDVYVVWTASLRRSRRRRTRSHCPWLCLRYYTKLRSSTSSYSFINCLSFCDTLRHKEVKEVTKILTCCIV